MQDSFQSRDQLSQLKVMPFSVEAEQALIGGLMLVDEAFDRVTGRARSDDFHRKDHALIFAAISELKERSQPADPITVAELLERKHLLEQAGGLAYLVELANNAPGAVGIVAHADIVRDKAIQRRLLDAGSAIVESIYRPEGRNTRELLNLAEEQVFRISQLGERAAGGFQSMREMLGEAYRTIEQRFNDPRDVTGLATGFTDFDKMTSGLHPGDLAIVAARPSMGKTAFAMNVAEYVSVRSGQPVGVFSMEMSAVQLTMRVLSSLCRIDQGRLRSGRLDDHEWAKLADNLKMISQAKLYVDDTPALTPAELIGKARRLKREHGLGLIVVDYLQLMQVPDIKENRATEISAISRGLKAVAKELGVPVIALSQLNRGVEQRTDKRPMMSDLRESGSIEQDADLVVMLYRDEYYNPESADKGVAEVIITKQRNGPTGTVKLTFRGQFTRFDNHQPTPFHE
jgi:replicative DNA helicase